MFVNDEHIVASNDESSLLVNEVAYLLTSSPLLLSSSGMVHRAVSIYVDDVSDRGFRALFGVYVEECAILWQELDLKRPLGGKPVHFLSCCLFLNVYGTEEVHCAITGVYPKKFRKKTWLFVSSISLPKVVRITDAHTVAT